MTTTRRQFLSSIGIVTALVTVSNVFGSASSSKTLVIEEDETFTIGDNEHYDKVIVYGILKCGDCVKIDHLVLGWFGCVYAPCVTINKFSRLNIDGELISADKHGKMTQCYCNCLGDSTGTYLRNIKRPWKLRDFSNGVNLRNEYVDRNRSRTYPMGIANWDLSDNVNTKFLPQHVMSFSESIIYVL
jgi:hypothetical protein